MRAESPIGLPTIRRSPLAHLLARTRLRAGRAEASLESGHGRGGILLEAPQSAATQRRVVLHFSRLPEIVHRRPRPVWRGPARRLNTDRPSRVHRQPDVLTGLQRAPNMNSRGPPRQSGSTSIRSTPGLRGSALLHRSGSPIPSAAARRPRHQHRRYCRKRAARRAGGRRFRSTLARGWNGAPRCCLRSRAVTGEREEEGR